MKRLTLFEFQKVGSSSFHPMIVERKKERILRMNNFMYMLVSGRSQNSVGGGEWILNWPFLSLVNIFGVLYFLPFPNILGLSLLLLVLLSLTLLLLISISASDMII